MPSKAERFAAQDRDSGVSAASEVMAKRYSSSARPQQLAPGEILFDPGNPREDGWQNNVKDLSASMLSVGVLEPISIVHRDVWLTEYPGREADIGDADWVVAYGNRRLAAAVVAELSTVPVQVKDNLAEQQRSQEARLIENVQRADLPPLVEAYEVVSLVKKHGTNRAVAKILGMSEGWVTQRKQLVNLTPELQTELTQQSITVEDARQLGKIPQLRQMEAYHAGKPYTDPADQPKTAPRQLPPGAPAVVDDHSPAADTEATQADSATASSDSNTGVVPRGRLSESAGRATQQAAPQQEAAPDPVTDEIGRAHV